MDNPNFQEVGLYVGPPEENPMAFGTLICKVTYGIDIIEDDTDYWIKKMIQPV